MSGANLQVETALDCTSVGVWERNT